MPYNQTILPDQGYDGLSQVFLYEYKAGLALHSAVSSETITLDISKSSTAGSISGRVNWNFSLRETSYVFSQDITVEKGSTAFRMWMSMRFWYSFTTRGKIAEELNNAGFVIENDSSFETQVVTMNWFKITEMSESGFNFSANTNRIGTGPVISTQSAQASINSSYLIEGS